jgi:3-methyl-2-oxobutanoate hydroxymethyltransferase
MTKRTVPQIHQSKNSNKKIVALTAYDYTIAKIIDQSNLVDLILVGDSLGCVVQGYQNTLPVSLDEMIYHTRCVTRAVENALVVADLPFMTYQVSKEQALQSAGRLIKEAGAEAVKLEGGFQMRETIAALVNVDIPVVGHIGLTPQSYHRMGGHKIQGQKNSKFVNNNAGTYEQLLVDALAVQDAGAFAIVLEGVTSDLATKLTAELNIPTIGISAGDSVCDGEILVTHDLLGLSASPIPKFVKPLADFKSLIEKAVFEYAQEVRGKNDFKKSIAL